MGWELPHCLSHYLVEGFVCLLQLGFEIWLISQSASWWVVVVVTVTMLMVVKGTERNGIVD